MKQRGFAHILYGILLFSLAIQVGYGQEYATLAPNHGSIGVGPGQGIGGVTNASQAASASTANFAVMRTDRLEVDIGLIKVVTGRNAYLQLKFPNNRPAGATTYVRISRPRLIGLNLDLADLLGLAGTSITSELYIGATAGNQSSSRGNKLDVGTKTEIVVDEHQNYYLAITPESSAVYNSVNITLSYPSGLLNLGMLEMNVYHAFTLAESSCSNKAAYTNFGEARGVNLNLLSQLVANPHYTINDNPSQYASFSSGVLGLGIANTISQTIYFDHIASTDDGVRVKLGLSNSLIGLGLANLNSVNFVAYHGGAEVWSEKLYSLSQLLGLDLLKLISIGSHHKELDMVFKPKVAFDRIEVQFNPGLLDLGVLGDALRLYNVSLVPSAPEILDAGQPDDITICEGETAVFYVNVTVPDGATLSYQWQYLNGETWQDISGAVSASLTLSNMPLNADGNTYRAKIVGGNSSCPQTVFSEQATLSVNLVPGKPHLTITDIIN